MHNKIYHNKIVLVTGVGKGIGKYLLKHLSENGAFVYGLTRSKTDIKKLKFKNTKIFHGDVRNIKLIKKIFIKAKLEKKIINSLVNNAGIRQRLNFEKISNKKIREIFDINFFSIFEIMKIFATHSKKNNIKSSIVNIGSIVGEAGFSQLSGYSSTKGALKSLTKSFAVEYAQSNIRANVVSPGFTQTSYFDNFKKNKKLFKWTLSQIPAKRWGKSEEVAKLIGFLISDESSYITGESINIDGGWIKSWNQKMMLLH